MRDRVTIAPYAIFVPAGGDVAAVKASFDKGVALTVGPVAETGFAPELLKYTADGLDHDAIRNAREAVTFVLEGDAAEYRDIQQRAVALARAAATVARGWILDPITGEVFSPESLDSRRPREAAFDVGDWIVVHMVRGDDSLVFLETRGLERFGLPELFLRSVPQTHGDDANTLVNATAQVLVDRGKLDRPGVLTVTGPAGTITWNVTWSRGDHDDARLLELTLPGAGTPAERLYAAMETFGGRVAQDVHYASTDDAELRAASQRARSELEALAPRWASGAPPMENLIVKAPFATDSGGTEWMWVEVQRWSGDTLQGLLTNDPVDVSTLRVGASVVVRAAEIFDYVHTRADGTRAGGATNAILERRSGN